MKIPLLLSSTTAVLICIIILTTRNRDKLQSAINNLHCGLKTSFCTPGTRYDYLGEHDEAIARNPQDANAYYNRARTKRYNPRIGDWNGALADLNQAIYLDPKMAGAYVERGNMKARSNDFQGALADYNQAISLYSQDSKSGTEDDRKVAYYDRASVKDRLTDAKGALADYDKYISLDPKSANAYKVRAALKADELKDFRGALADYKKALSLSKNESIMSDSFPARGDDIGEMHWDREKYTNRAKLKAEKLRDPQAAITYYTELIKLSEKSEDVLYEHIYVRRADVKANRLNDLRGALADYDRAIKLSPKGLFAYKARAEFQATKLSNFRGALADYNQTIDLDLDLGQPDNDLAELYLARGNLKYTKLKDRAGGIADTKKALQSAKKDGDTEVSNMAIEQLKSWGISN